MANVPMKKRCKGWVVFGHNDGRGAWCRQCLMMMCFVSQATGSCPDRKDKRPLMGSCKYCDLMLMASTKKRLCEVIIYHMRSSEGKKCQEQDRKKYPKKWKMIDRQQYMDGPGAFALPASTDCALLKSSEDLFGSSNSLNDIQQYREDLKRVGISDTIMEDQSEESNQAAS
mmetsp:Transcript_32525/g.60520  ORF Transcript_32525/g.60520 Transcript_32525/m.60520 type:complete len:171 (-) Transcript_32525:257-769(-)